MSFFPKKLVLESGDILDFQGVLCEDLAKILQQLV